LTDSLDIALLDRLREMLASPRATEAELRTMAEQSDAWAQALRVQIENGEQRLGELDADPDSLLAKMADELRRVEALRNELAELDRFRRDLDRRAHDLRAVWLGRQTAT
jgi:phage-related minor tail protein